VLADINQSELAAADFVSEQYFGVLRNYRRYGWLVLYLFGTSPAVSKSFFAGRETDLPSLLDADTLLRAVRHLAAHERHRLSQQESSDGERVGQQLG
jgi:gamma-glutamylcysteine synthetase